MNVYIFKTSISPQDISFVNSILRSVIPKSSWNFDLEDCDPILRVESKKNITKLVQLNLQRDGFECEELL